MNTSNYPVEQVSWYDAIYFCNKLSVKERKTPVYAVDGETDVEKWNYTTHQKKANGYGLYDMSGNVDEWCWETSDKSEGLRRAIVCGGWYIQNDDKLKLNECSSDALKGTKYGCIGFRVVCARSE